MKSVYTSCQTHFFFCGLHFFRTQDFLFFFDFLVIDFSTNEIASRFNNPVKLCYLTSYVILHVIVEFYRGMKMYV